MVLTLKTNLPFRPIIIRTLYQLASVTVLAKAEVTGGASLVGELNLGPRVWVIVKLKLPLLGCFCGWRVAAAGIVAREQNWEAGTAPCPTTAVPITS